MAHINIVFLVCILSVARGFEYWKSQFNNHKFLDRNEKYELYWNADQNKYILDIGLAVVTDGWIAFGISKKGDQMADSDIVIGWVTNDGEYILSNRKGLTQSAPVPFKDQSHIKKISGWKQQVDNITTTYIRFHKEMFPQFDPAAVPLNNLGPSNIIWAYRNGELSEDGKPLYHGFCEGDGCRGSDSLNLVEADSTIFYVTIGLVMVICYFFYYRQ